jgi:hypothetical protein
MNHNKKNLELSGDAFINLQNIFEIILELGEGKFTFEELVLTIDRLFKDMTNLEKRDLAVKTLKVIATIN